MPQASAAPADGSSVSRRTPPVGNHLSVRTPSYSRAMPRFTWSETAIAEALEPVVSELGRMPSRAELKDRGLAGAWDAMRRRGGIDAWAERLTTNGNDPSDDPAAGVLPLAELARNRSGDTLAAGRARARGGLSQNRRLAGLAPLVSRQVVNLPGRNE